MILMDSRGNPTRELKQCYRNVFGSLEGKAVLLHMLHELGHFGGAPMESEGVEAALALKNYASRVLLHLGPESHDATAIAITEGIVDTLTAIPLEKKE